MPNLRMNSIEDEPERKFKCGLCFFTTNRKCDYIRHMLTQKHKDNCKLTSQKKCSNHYCACGKTYKHRSGLSRHKAICPVNLQLELDILDESQDENDDGFTSIGASSDVVESVSETIPNTEEPTRRQESQLAGDNVTSLLTDIAQQLREMKETQERQQQQITSNVNNNYILNLNMFLNENCKDALSLQDFFKQITFVFDDLKDNAWRSRVLLNNLGSLQLEDRPFHCLDTSTCQVVMKNGSRWQQGSKDDIVSTLDSCGKQVQTQFGPQWDLQYPGWADSDSHSRQYVDLWRNITKEPSQSQVEEDLKRVSHKTTLPTDKQTPCGRRMIK